MRALDEIHHVLTAAQTLAVTLPGVVAVGLAGSWARGAARPDSDVDLLVLTTEAEVALTDTAWFAVFDPAAELIRSGDLGAVQERRLRLPDGTVVEIGIGAPSWAALDPVDAGTHRVVSDGFVVLHDPDGLLQALTQAVTGAGGEPAPGRF